MGRRHNHYNICRGAALLAAPQRRHEVFSISGRNLPALGDKCDFTACLFARKGRVSREARGAVQARARVGRAQVVNGLVECTKVQAALSSPSTQGEHFTKLCVTSDLFVAGSGGVLVHDALNCLLSLHEPHP